jgi:hypothetical protein
MIGEKRKVLSGKSKIRDGSKFLNQKQCKKDLGAMSLKY